LRAFLATVASYNPLTISRPTVSVSAPYPAEFMFSFLTTSNSSVTYYLEYSTNLASPMEWTTIGSTPGVGAAANLFDLNPSGQRRFYRVRVQ
jgi:hypothetical protein